MKRDLSLDFFFHRRGVELQRTMIGMLRSFLCQMYTKVPSVRKIILHPFREKRILGEVGTAWQWQLKELRDLFVEAVMAVAASMRMAIFVDALDEAGDKGARDLASYFHELNDRLDQSAGTAKICISCRHYPIVARIPGLEIWVEKHNGDDISLYVHHMLRVNLHIKEPTALQDLESIIAKRSSGVFQWTRLVLPMVAECVNDGESMEDIHEMLARVPQGLSDVYEHIFKVIIKPRNYGKALLLMQWVCLAEKPLSLTELRFAMAADNARIHSSQNGIGLVESDERMEKLTASLSGGLVEIQRHSSGSIAQFVHQSVNDYLHSSGLAFLVSLCKDMITSDNCTRLNEDCNNDIVGQSQDRLTRFCVNYLLSGETVQTGRILIDSWLHERVSYNSYWEDQAQNLQIRGELVEKLPFIIYATRYWFVHAEKAEIRGFFQTHLVDEFGSPPGLAFQHWTKFDQICEDDRYKPIDFKFYTTLLHVACISNLPSIGRVLLDQGTGPNDKDTTGNSPLHHAARKGSDKLAHMLIKSGAEIDAINNTNNTPLELAAANGFVEKAKRLLLAGADVNKSTGESGNALSQQPPIWACPPFGHLFTPK